MFSMFPLKWTTGVAFAIAVSINTMPLSYAGNRVANFINDDDVFQALRDAARRDDAAKAGQLAARLSNYPIPAYVDYYRLKPQIKDATDAEIRAFLTRYNGMAIADRLRNDWLLELGRQRNWAVFDEQYPLFVLDDDVQVKCFALMSKSFKGRSVADDARNLLVSPKDYGEPCTALITTLAQNGQFTADDIWAQMRLAGEQGYLPTARRMSALTGVSEKMVEQAIEHPSATVTRGIGKKGNESRQLFIIALGRIARNDPEKAARALTAVASRLTPQEQALGWAQIALQASYKLLPEALTKYWAKADGVPLSSEAYQWRVRMALRAGDWKAVKAGIDAMPESLRNNAAWVYWRARALKQENRQDKQDEAEQLFHSIADQIQFYGQLAQEELGRKISIPQNAQQVTAAELAAIGANAGLRRSIKFFEMNLRFEGIREWNWELRRLNEREHFAAAEFARQNNLLDRMVSTSDRTKTEFDFMQRYPSPFRDFMYSATNALGLDMAWVYGLIRQESRFVQNARSHVGASGLMQLMPSTANFVARKIGMTDYHHGKVNDMNVNIVLGTHYLNMVLKDLDGSQALATAAYNAGPGRPRLWRSMLTRPVEGAIFAESIPFSETRGYVKSVLSNATYYAALFEGKPQSLKARLGYVAPKGFAATDLP